MFKLSRLPLVVLATATLSLPAIALAQEAPEVVVTSDMRFAEDGVWMHSLDAYEAEAGKENASLARALSVYRMMEAEGVDPERIKLAVVIHGPSVFDVANAARYDEKYAGQSNPNEALVADLIARGAEIWVCGVAAKYHRVGNAHLLPGVQMAPSATIAHAELQRRGFGINPY